MILSPEETARKLDLEPKYRIRIRPDPNNSGKYTSEQVIVNGYTYLIPVGEYCQVPETVYKILEGKNLV